MTTTWVEVRHFLFVLYLLYKHDLNLKVTQRKDKLKLRHFMTLVFCEATLFSGSESNLSLFHFPSTNLLKFLGGL
jgi:hypothetical protein